jgi:hypothetical protein
MRALGHEVTRWTLAKAAAAYGYGVWAIRADKAELPMEGAGKLALEPGVDIIKYLDLWNHADLVHITNPPAVTMGFQEVVDKKGGPVVVTLHDSAEVMFNEGSGAMEALMSNADRIFFVGEVWMRMLRRQGRIPTRDFDRKARFFPHPYVRDGAGRIVEPEKRIVCTSAWRWNKKIELTIDAAQLLAPDGYTVEFWTGAKDPQYAPFLQTLPGWACCSDMGTWRWPQDCGKVFGTAAYLTNMTTFGATDGLRTEYPILEAWDFGVTPIVRSCWAAETPGQSEGAPVEGIDCLVADTGAEIAAAVRAGIDFEQDAFDAALKPHVEVGPRIAAEYAEAMKA